MSALVEVDEVSQRFAPRLSFGEKIAVQFGSTIEAIHSASPTAIIPIFLYFHPIAASTKATNASIRRMTLKVMPESRGISSASDHRARPTAIRSVFL